MTKTVEQLKTEAAEATAALKEAEAKAQEAVRAAEKIEADTKRAAAQAIENAKNMEYASEIIGQLQVLGHRIVIGEKLTFSSFPMFVWADTGNAVNDLAFDTYYSESSYSYRRSNAEKKITVGDYNNRSHYRLRKDGTFNYAAIAKKFDEKHKSGIAVTKRLNEKNRIEAHNKAIIHSLCKTYGTVVNEKMSSWGDEIKGVKLTPSEFDENVIKAKFEYGFKSVSEDRAVEFIQMVQRWAAEDKAAKE